MLHFLQSASWPGNMPFRLIGKTPVFGAGYRGSSPRGAIMDSRIGKPIGPIEAALREHLKSGGATYDAIDLQQQCGDEGRLSDIIKRIGAEVTLHQIAFVSMKVRKITPAAKVKAKKHKDRYRHPRWTKLRNKVMKRALGQCERCHTAKAEHVHHLSYAKGKGVTRLIVPMKKLQALCLPCHQAQHPFHIGDVSDETKDWKEYSKLRSVK